MTTQVEMMKLLLNETGLDYVQLKTVGEAISAEMATQSMVPQVERLATSHGWITTQRNGCRISIETEAPTILHLFQDCVLYHVSQPEHRSSILAEGLEPGTGGNTSLNRSYKPRLHLVAFLGDAFQFIHHQHKSSRVLRYTSPLDAFDIYAVDGKKGLPHHNDDHFDGRGLWITHGIPPGDLTLIEPGKWHDLYRAMYAGDDPEFTRTSAEKAPI